MIIGYQPGYHATSKASKPSLYADLRSQAAIQIPMASVGRHSSHAVKNRWKFPRFRGLRCFLFSLKNVVKTVVTNVICGVWGKIGFTIHQAAIGFFPHSFYHNTLFLQSQLVFESAPL